MKNTIYTVLVLTIFNCMTFGVNSVDNNGVSQDECMNVCLERIKQCWGEQDQGEQIYAT